MRLCRATIQVEVRATNNTQFKEASRGATQKHCSTSALGEIATLQFTLPVVAFPQSYGMLI